MPTNPKSLDELVALKQWTQDQARVVLDAGKRSGLSLAAFARRHALDPRRLYWWRGQLPRAERPVAFEEVALLGAAVRPALQAGHATTGLELVLPSGHIVRLGAAFDAATLRRLLEVLERRDC